MIDPKTIDVPREIHTPRLIIRAAEPGMGAMKAEAIQNGWDYGVYKYCPWAKDRTIYIEENCNDQLAELQQQWHDRAIFVYGVFTRDDPHHILGEVELYGPNWDWLNFDTGFWFCPRGTGQGYAYEAELAMVMMGRTVFGAQRIAATVQRDNLKSQRLLEKIGFVREGIWRNAYVQKDGVRADSIAYSLIASDPVPTLDVTFK